MRHTAIMLKKYPARVLILLCAALINTACTYTALAPASTQEILATHNQLRARHGVKKLTWDRTLERYAARYAANCQFKHSHSRYGENLAAGYPTLTSAIKAWYNEIKYYPYQHPGFSHGTGHFTQLVWKSSTSIGCAYVDCNGKNGTPGHYLVCEYDPAGNVINPGYFKKNVLPLQA